MRYRDGKRLPNGSALLGFVVRRLNGGGRSRWEEIAATAGVPYDTLTKIATGYTLNPGVRSVERLAVCLGWKFQEPKRL